MNKSLTKVLEHIRDSYRNKACKGARHYTNIRIGTIAEKLNLKNIDPDIADREVIISLKDPQPGMKVRIDGRTFIRYAEYADGFAVPEAVAMKAGIKYQPYTPQNSMILNYT